MNQKLPPLKLLHTSDWHIGRTLYSRKRYEEFGAFLTWLADTIQQNEIDALLGWAMSDSRNHFGLA